MTHPVLIWFFLIVLALAGLALLTIGVIVVRNLIRSESELPQDQPEEPQ